MGRPIHRKQAQQPRAIPTRPPVARTVGAGQRQAKSEPAHDDKDADRVKTDADDRVEDRLADRSQERGGGFGRGLPDKAREIMRAERRRQPLVDIGLVAVKVRDPEDRESFDTVEPAQALPARDDQWPRVRHQIISPDSVEFLAAVIQNPPRNDHQVDLLRAFKDVIDLGVTHPFLDQPAARIAQRPQQLDRLLGDQRN